MDDQDGGTDVDASDKLIQLFSKLAERLASSSFESEREVLQRRGDASLPDHLWLLLTTTDDQSSQETGAADDTMDCLVQNEVRPLLSQMTPFDLHSTVSQVKYFSSNDGTATADAAEDGNDNDNQDSTTKNDYASLYYPTLCILCMVFALRQCRAEDDKALKRPKRWKSLVWETLRAFHELANLHVSMNICCLLANHVIPATLQVVLGLLMQEHTPAAAAAAMVTRRTDPKANLSTAFVASVVAVVGRVNLQCFLSNDDDAQSLSSSSKLLLSALEDVLGNTNAPCLEQVVVRHPWRPRREKLDSTLESFEQSLSYWTTSPNAEEDGFDIRVEALNYLDSSWKSIDIAVLSALLFEHGGRVQVWHPDYVWYLWFPHVRILLLNAEQKVEVHNDDDQDDAPWTSRLLFELALKLLNRMLVTMMPGTLKAPPLSTNHSFEADAALRPDDPIPTLQLLSNRVIAAAPAANPNAGGDSPSPPALFMFMQRLVSVYKPCNQVSIVQRLVRDCPHSGLKPKLLDLLRPLVVAQPSAVHQDGDDAAAAMQALWKYVDSIIQQLEAEHLRVPLTKQSDSKKRDCDRMTTSICNTEPVMMDKQASSDDDDPPNGRPRLKQVDELIQSAELYGAALELMRLDMMLQKRAGEGSAGGGHSKSTLEVSRFQRLKLALEGTLSMWDNKPEATRTCPPPAQHHRLFLLDLSLEQLLDGYSEGQQG